jgi:hypothetical protein
VVVPDCVGELTLIEMLQAGALTMARAQAGLDMVKSKLDRVGAEGRVFWLSPCAIPNPPPGRVVDLVQGYDEVVRSYGESRDTIVGQVARAKTDSRPPLLHPTLSEGKVVGRRRRHRTESTVETFFYRPLVSEEMNRWTDME